MSEPTTGSIENGEGAGEFADRPDDLEGSHVAYVDLGKPNGEELYDSLQATFPDEFGVEEFSYYKKPHYSSPMPSDQISEVIDDGADAVIEAISDCGSCNSSSAIDAIEFEQRGIPTVQIITDEFIELNANIAGSRGYEELPIVAVEHPTRYLDREEIDELVDRIKWSVQTVLTCEECLVGQQCSIED